MSGSAACRALCPFLATLGLAHRTGGSVWVQKQLQRSKLRFHKREATIGAKAKRVRVVNRTSCTCRLNSCLPSRASLGACQRNLRMEIQALSQLMFALSAVACNRGYRQVCMRLAPCSDSSTQGGVDSYGKPCPPAQHVSAMQSTSGGRRFGCCSVLGGRKVSGKRCKKHLRVVFCARTSCYPYL